MKTHSDGFRLDSRPQVTRRSRSPSMPIARALVIVADCAAGRRRRARLAAGLLLAVGLLAGCAPGGGPAAATQVAARVNDSEITVHQIGYLMSSGDATGLGRIDTARADAPAREDRRVLEQLIDQELLVQAALAQKADRNPDVLAELEAARRAVLARAYLQGIDGAARAPDEAEIRAYGAAHPALFAERRVYTLRELTLTGMQGAAGAAQEERLRALWNSARRWDALVAAVEESGPARWSEVTRAAAAEQLPLDQVDTLHALAPGEVHFTRDGDRLVVRQVLRAAREPMGADAAHRLIEAYLREQALLRAEQDELARLRSAARVERVGDYAPAPAAVPAGAARPAPQSRWLAPRPLARHDAGAPRKQQRASS